MRVFNRYLSPLRQSAKQRKTSEIAESKFRYNPLKNPVSIKIRSAFAHSVMTNRYLMRNVKNFSNVSDYTSSIYQIQRSK